MSAAVARGKIDGPALIEFGKMKSFHDLKARQALLSRIDRLTPQSKGLFGSMRVDQMLRHLNSAMEMTLGRYKVEKQPSKLPRPLFKFLVMVMPWPKAKAQTAPELVAADTYEFENERTKLKALVNEAANRSPDGHWVDHPAFGPMNGFESSKLQYKHIDHHLKQFGV